MPTSVRSSMLEGLMSTMLKLWSLMPTFLHINDYVIAIMTTASVHTKFQIDTLQKADSCCQHIEWVLS